MVPLQVSKILFSCRKVTFQTSCLFDFFKDHRFDDLNYLPVHFKTGIMVVKTKQARIYARTYQRLSWLFLLLIFGTTLPAQNIISNGEPAELNIRKAGENSIRLTLKPVSYKGEFPFSPALSSMQYSNPAISLRKIDKTVKKRVGNLKVEISSNPLKITVRNLKNQLIQELVFLPDGNLSFTTGDQPVLGMGEGGPKPAQGLDWRKQPIQFDRRGSYDSMQPRWQSDAYGSRNPVAMLTGTEGWGLFVVTPWVEVDLTAKETGVFIPWKPPSEASVQSARNQHLNKGKGLPPIDKIVPGLYDVFVFDAHQPKDLMKDFSLSLVRQLCRLNGHSGICNRFARGTAMHK